jgi:hypothetical protein
MVRGRTLCQMAVVLAISTSLTGCGGDSSLAPLYKATPFTGSLSSGSGSLLSSVGSTTSSDSSASTPIDETSTPIDQISDINFSIIPDAALVSCIEKEPEILISEITSLYCRNDPEYITDLSGIEQFIALEHLSLNEAHVTTVDLSANTELVSFVMFRSQIESIDMRSNLKLKYLDLYGSTKLVTVDISENQMLESLELAYTAITSIDLSTKTLLKSLNLSGAPIASIDLTQNTSLEYLELYESLLVGNVDLSAFTSMIGLAISGSNITSLDLPESLTSLTVGFTPTPITTLDLSGILLLSSLSVSQTNMTAINLNANSELRFLDLYSSQLTSIDVGSNINLVHLFLSYNQLSTIDVSNNLELESLWLEGNPAIPCSDIQAIEAQFPEIDLISNHCL